jgi:uncharacterized protein (TIGR02687 family)
MKQIHSSLERVFDRHRLVFWYDGAGEWTDTFDSFDNVTVTKLEVRNPEFGTKVRIVQDPNPGAKFLVYIPSPRPDDSENWLLDLLLQGYEYKADKASLALQEVGLSQDFLPLAQEHARFFLSEKRVGSLKTRLHQNDEEREIRLKMMAVLAGSHVAADVDALLMHFLSAAAPIELFDPVEQHLGSTALVGPFWREVGRAFNYTAPTPSLRDFAVSLFRGANPLDGQVTLHPHSIVFLQHWKDSQTHRESYRLWANQMEKELQVEQALNGLEDAAQIGDWDTFELFERFTLHRLCRSFETGDAAVELLDRIRKRRVSFWYPEHRPGYAALEHAVELRELLAGIELTVTSIDTGLTRYLASWWKLDRAYRLCIVNLRLYGQVQLMENISGWVERSYLNNFLLPLADRWSDQARRLEVWGCDTLPAQRQFFELYVRPFLARGQKVFVIASDALRYEAAADFASRIQVENRWTAEVNAMLGSLPSYTQLGMASLLPGKQWTINPENSNVILDGRSASGTANRAEILELACNGKGIAIQAEDFLEMNTKTDGRALMRDHEVIYIFHNVIDKAGDDSRTEAKTFDAVEQAFDELEQIIKKVANINGSNMLLTADHGFLFQQDDLHERDMTPFPKAIDLTFRNRRFAIGTGVQPEAAVKIFDAASLGLSGDWSAAFPLSLSRMPLQGSGKRYVHGGISLQEVVIPVVKIHKARSNDTVKVEVEFTHVPNKITTGQVSFALFQDRPAVDKVLPRILRVGLHSKDNVILSEVKTISFDSQQEEARQRESTILLTLSRAADNYNNHEVLLRLEETMLGTNQVVLYKSHKLKLQKPFASDFDEF